VADADVPPPIEDSGADPKDARRGEVFIPAGYAFMGGEEAGRQPVPAFFLFGNEVTVKEFAACVVAHSCSSRHVEGPTVEHPKRPRSVDCNWGRRGREQHPMNCVTLAQAESYCRWKGARLPREREWVRGARSDGRSPYPWGDELASCERTIMADAEGSGCGVASSHAIDDKPEDVSTFGVRNLAGNVAEWVRAGSGALIKGGSWLDEDPKALRIDARGSLAPTERSSRVGFRCARSGE
jgi:serine/threonine-protein kinase